MYKIYSIWLMRLSILMVFITCVFLQLSLASHGQVVTLKRQNTTIKVLFKEIQKQSGYHFVYTEELLEKSNPVTVEAYKLSIVPLLNLIFQNQPFRYQIEDKTVVVKPKEKVYQTSKTSYKDKEVHGRVVDSLGKPLSGASIQVYTMERQKTDFKTLTDKDGRFELLNVPENASIFISYVGYNPKMIPITSNLANIILTPVISEISEVEINAGYYQVKQRESTGSIARVSGAEIQKQPVSNPLAALIGRMPGVHVIQSSGIPGSSFSVEIRGRNSISGSSQPLYIIDGVPFSNEGMGSTEVGFILGYSSPSANQSLRGLSPMAGINPGDIESIEILKDADATAIYGSRGANGVVLITTRKFDKSRSNFNIRYSKGLGKLTKRYRLLNTEQYLEIRREAFENDGIPIGKTDYDINGTWDQNRYTDWQKELVGGTAEQDNLQLSIQGGSEYTNYLLTGSTFKETSVFPGNYANKKLSTRSVVNHRSSNNRFKLSTNFGFMSDRNNLPGVDLNYYAVTIPPNAPKLYNEDGSLNWENNTWDNPMAQNEQKYLSKFDNLSLSLNISQEIINNLLLSINAGSSYGWMDDSRTKPHTLINPYYGYGPESSSIMQSSTKRKSWIIEPQLSYKREWQSGLTLNTLIGATFQENTQEFLEQTAVGFTSNSLIYNLKSAKTILINNTSETEYRYSAIFGRANIGFKDRYYVNFTGRRDGSSRFGPGNQFANFGAVGAAWIFTEEAFAKNNLNFLSYGKLRGSYGITGSDNIGDYKFLDSYSSSSNLYDGIAGLAPNSLFNPDFAWETNSKIEAAIELGFLNNRLNVLANYYSNRSSNQLVGIPLPSITGFTSIHSNLPATVQNTGFELEITSKNWSSKKFEWSTLMTLTIPRNKLIAFPNLEKSTYANMYMVGQPLNISRRYKYLGVDEQTGLYQYHDVNGDGKFNIDDRTTILDLNPKYYAGLNNSFTIGSFQLDIFFQMTKQLGRNQWSQLSNLPGLSMNQSLDVWNRWQNPGDQANIQRISTLSNTKATTAFNNLWYSDASIGDASFIRLKNVNIAYNLPRNLWKSFGGSVFIQGQNVWTITKFDGADPESNATANKSIAPLRMWTAGLQLNF